MPQVHTININPDTGEAKILLVGVKDPLVTMLTPAALQAVLASTAQALLESFLPGYQAAPAASQPPLRRATPRRTEPVIEDPDDDPVLDDVLGELDYFERARDEVEHLLRDVFDEDYEVDVSLAQTTEGPQIVTVTTSPGGAIKRTTLTAAQWAIDGQTVRPYVSNHTGRVL